jgi:hypothetical protein
MRSRLFARSAIAEMRLSRLEGAAREDGGGDCPPIKRPPAPAGTDQLPSNLEVTASDEPTKRIAEAAIERKFFEWRTSRGSDVPTYDEDVAHMKQFGVGRNAVRVLRKSAPRLQRGKPKQKSE